MRRSMLCTVLGGCLALVGCQRDPEPAMPAASPGFTTGELHFASVAGSAVLRVEIAETPEQHRIGLSRRRQIGEDEGMIFLFREEQPRDRSFWMFRTSIPLSIAFLDADQVIRRVQDMEPCIRRFSLFCRRYRAGVPFHAAVEARQGYFAHRELGVGDRVVLHRDRGS